MRRSGSGVGGSRCITRRPLFLLAALILFSAGLRLYHLDNPAEKVFDEFHYVSAAQVMAGVADNPGALPDPYHYHPPLGKLIIATGIRLFGDNPFGWRIFAVLFGLISITLLFQIARKLFDSFFLAWTAASIYSLDFLHIIHSRLAMLDILLVAPVLGGMLALLYLLENSRSLAWLAAGSVSWAVALAVKTSALVYLAAALIVYLVLSRERIRSRIAIIITLFSASILLFSLSYFYYRGHGFGFFDWLALRWDATFNFTSRAPSHPYESAPPMWLFNARAIWYHFDGEARTAIFGFGNPALWLPFLPALFIVFCAYKEQRKRLDLLLLLWFALSYLPWYFILWHRGGFLYYMLPAIAPMALLIVRTLTLVAAGRRYFTLSYAYLIVLSLLFVIFAPLLLGLPMLDYYQVLVAKVLYS